MRELQRPIVGQVWLRDGATRKVVKVLDGKRGLWTVKFLYKGNAIGSMKATRWDSWTSRAKLVIDSERKDRE